MATAPKSPSPASDLSSRSEPTPAPAPTATPVTSKPQGDDWRDRIATASLKAFGRLPLRVNRFIGANLGRLLRLCRASASTTTRVNLAHVWPSLGEGADSVPFSPEALQRLSVTHMGKTATEMALAWQRSHVWCLDQIVAVHGKEHLDRALAADVGVIILSPHLGNWEFLIHYIGEVCPAITSLYQPAKFQRMDQMIHDARQRCTQLAPTNRQGVMRLLKALKRGEAIGILPDQVPLSGGGEYAPFFGQRALTMTLVRQLQRKSGALVLSAFAKRVPNGFDIHLMPVDERLYSEDDQESLVGLNASVEACVRLAPEQYQWEYKRFRRLPAAENHVYD